MLTKQAILLGKSTRVESGRLAVLGSVLMGLVSGWSLANHLIQSLSWWRTHHSARMEASKRDSGKWMDTRCLLLTFLELFRLVVAY